MRVLITGATGLIGTALTRHLLSDGVDIHFLTTSKKDIRNSNRYTGFHYNPQKGYIDENALIGVEAIVHLAGASISKRWTDAYKQEIIESRIFTANLLFKTLKQNPHQVKQIVSASAIGIYPDSLTGFYTEDAADKDTGFLGHVVDKWEASIDKFRLLDIKVCKIRTGLVLSSDGGALVEMEKPIKLGIGAPFGSGKQWQSWIHLDDIASIYQFAINQALDGVYNGVAPNPVTNETLTKAIAAALHKPCFMPNTPKFLMKLILGEMHELLFSSQKVSSEKLRAAGYKFKFDVIETALHDIYK